MKKNVSGGWPLSVSVGAIFLAVFYFRINASAGLIVGNLSQTVAGNYNANGYVEETFTPNLNTTLGSVTMNLNYSAAASGTISLYQLTPGLAFVATLGTVSSSTSGTANYTISGLSEALISGDQYIIQLASGNSDISWNYVSGHSTSSGSIGTFDGIFYNNASLNDPNNSFAMELDAVPEVPMTGIAMGLGAVAICGFDLLRRKKTAAIAGVV